ncbi:HNH endonuclease family protein [Actinotalea caeni]|uniref:HNH endonuclease family protein n=1 Tax=Actinotalea caeni TaxID=1348467 RepID=UPI002B4B0796|nr:HNH endonuclease family protein [Actinotalea caeni]
MRRPIALLVVLALATAVACVVPLWWARVRPVAPTPVDPGRVEAARAALAALRVTEPLPLEGYRRDLFGEPWADVDGNGCDTRNDVLAAWLTDVRLDPARPCLVVSGTLRDPYTGHLVEFVRGPDTSAEVQIDHVVALADAWRKGASSWPPHLALAFANDPANLVPTSAATNQDKGADDAARWLPPNAGYHCAYAVQQVQVKAAYDVGVTSEEHAALREALAGCRGARGRPVSGPAVSLAPERGPGRSPDGREAVGRVRTRRHRDPLGDRPDRRSHLRVRAAAPSRRGAGAGAPAGGRRPGPRARGSPG